MDLILSRTPDPAATSIQDRIRLAVEQDILSGHRPPGSAIDEKQLASDFKASRTPVREALLMLAAQGLVQIVPRAGIYVRKASSAELVATLEALAELETVVARLAARRASAVQCEQLQQALAQASDCAARGDRTAYALANAALHEVIYRSSGNPVLVGHVRGVRKTLAAYRQRGFDKPGRLATSDQEHRRVVAAICSGDEAAAGQAMYTHIHVGGEAMAALVLASSDAALQAPPPPAPGPAARRARPGAKAASTPAAPPHTSARRRG